MPTYPSPDDWTHASSRQRDRARRSFSELQRREVPVYPGPLFVDDEEHAAIQSAQDVARRTMVLWAVELRAEGVPCKDVLAIINEHSLSRFVSPKERRFLEDKNPSADECQRLIWRLESLWVLMWSLGYIAELKWPGQMCDVPTLATHLHENEENPDFIEEAQLRSATEILDAQDLTMRIHWAVRDALLHQGGMVPEELDRSGDPDFVPVKLSAAAGVVQERHYVLNWLANYGSPANWDEVDTPT